MTMPSSQRTRPTAPASNMTHKGRMDGPSFSPAPVKQENKVGGGDLNTLEETGTGHC